MRVVSAALLGAGGLLLLGACRTANVVPTAEEKPKQELIYLVSGREAAEVARQVLVEQKFEVAERPEKGGVDLWTSANEMAPAERNARRFDRYLVQVRELRAGQTLVRVYRVEFRNMDEAIESGYNTGPGKTSRVQENEAERFARAKSQAGGFTTEFIRPSEKSDLNDVGFQGTWGLEPNRAGHARRELSLERVITERLEAVPSLEMVGGQLPRRVQALAPEVAEADADGPGAGPADCSTPLPGAGPLLDPGGTLLVADPIGTRELPQALAGLLCGAAAETTPVVLALAMPSSEQPLLDAYLASEGRAPDVMRLLTQGTFWRRMLQDGRSSRAVLALVEHARRLRAGGAAVHVAAVDAEKASGAAREVELAENVLAQRRAHPEALLVVAAGDVHVRPKAGTAWDGSFVPMGRRVKDAVPGARALNVAFLRGTQHGCRFNAWGKVECRVFGRSPTRELAQAPDAKPGVELFPQPDADGFDGRLNLGALSASPPVLGATQLAQGSTP